MEWKSNLTNGLEKLPMNPENNQFSFFHIISLANGFFAVFLDEAAFTGQGAGDLMTANEIAELLG